MRLLVTTSHSLLLLDSETGRARRIDSGRGLYYGIARHAGRLYVAARRRLVSSNSAPAAERGEILVFDAALRPLPSLRAPFPLRDLHQIAWHGGKLWLTCSHDNMIAMYDGRRWERWYPFGQRAGADSDHFNSLLFEAGRVWLLAHRRGPSALLAFSLRTRTLLEQVALGECGHNIWREDGQLLSCSSAQGRLLGASGFMLDSGGFPRGVAFDAGTRCVGVSELTERKARDFTSGAVRVYERDWRPRHRIELAGEGLVLDLARVPARFAAGRHLPEMHFALLP